MKETEQKEDLNERFTFIADTITTLVGQWWFTVLSLLLLTAWVIYGIVFIASHDASWFTSQAWNFPLNTVTTVGEWFLGAFVLAATNRVERKNRLIQDDLLKITQEIAKINKKEVKEIGNTQDHLSHQDEIMMDALTRIEEQLKSRRSTRKKDASMDT